MKIRYLFVLVVAVVLGLYQMPKWCAVPEERTEAYVYRMELNKFIQDMACVKEGPFPFSTREGRKSAATGFVDHTCAKCDVLYQAGLLDKSEYEYTPEGDESGHTKIEERYALTDLGRSVYIEGTGDGPHSSDPPRFCFGKAQVHKITRTIGPVNQGGTKYVGIRYIAELETPHPYLNDPRAKLLGIPLPSGDPLLYPEANVTAVFYPNANDFELDESITIGP